MKYWVLIKGNDCNIHYLLKFCLSNVISWIIPLLELAGNGLMSLTESPQVTWWEHSWVDSCGHWVLAWTEQTYNQLDKLLNLSLTTWSDSLLKLYHSYGTRQNFQTFPRTGLICPELQRSLFLLTLALLDLWEVLLERGNTQGRRSRGSWTSPRTGPAGRCWEFLMSGVLTPRGLRTRDRPPGGWWRQDSLIEKQRALERPHKGLDNSLGWACVL